jgi:hypothetical protein
LIKDAWLDARDFQSLAALGVVVGFVGIDRRLVTLDQGVAGLAVVQLGRGHDGPADQIRALVNGDMRLLAERRLAILFR